MSLDAIFKTPAGTVQVVSGLVSPPLNTLIFKSAMVILLLSIWVSDDELGRSAD
jgi:hypothetical protein